MTPEPAIPENGHEQPISELENTIEEQKGRVAFFREREMPAMTVNAEYTLQQMESRLALRRAGTLGN